MLIYINTDVYNTITVCNLQFNCCFEIVYFYSYSYRTSIFKLIHPLFPYAHLSMIVALSINEIAENITIGFDKPRGCSYSLNF